MDGLGNKSADQLLLLVERAERLHEDRKALADDLKDLFGEAKSNGYDTKTMKRVIQLRKMDPEARREAAALLETYCRALGLE